MKSLAMVQWPPNNRYVYQTDDTVYPNTFWSYPFLLLFCNHRNIMSMTYVTTVAKSLTTEKLKIKEYLKDEDLCFAQVLILCYNVIIIKERGVSI